MVVLYRMSEFQCHNVTVQGRKCTVPIKYNDAFWHKWWVFTRGQNHPSSVLARTTIEWKVLIGSFDYPTLLTLRQRSFSAGDSRAGGREPGNCWHSGEDRAVSDSNGRWWDQPGCKDKHVVSRSGLLFPENGIFSQLCSEGGSFHFDRPRFNLRGCRTSGYLKRRTKFREILQAMWQSGSKPETNMRGRVLVISFNMCCFLTAYCSKPNG